MKVEFSLGAKKQFLKLDKQIQIKIKNYILEIKNLDDIYSRGKKLTGNLKGLWRYRVGDYRIICNIQNDIFLITVLRISHRKDAYR